MKTPKIKLTHLTTYWMFFILISFGSKAQNTLDFSYDSSGNQMLRSESFNRRDKDSISIIPEHTIIDIMDMTPEIIENAFRVSPNPTSGLVTLSWDAAFNEQITNIEMVSLVSSEKTPVALSRGNSISTDLTGKITGLYLIIFYLKDAPVGKVQKKIIKL